jgi:signal transduction histidine kinase
MIDNALRHSSGASIVPLITFARDPGGQLLLGVRDYGPGVITDEQLARLSEPFYRPDSARTRSTGGVGLGLYLCRLVAEAHGGSLSIGRVTPGLEVTARWPAVTRSG